MKSCRLVTLANALAAVLLQLGCAKSPASSGAAVLAETFDLTGVRSRKPQEFALETRNISYAPDGKRGVTDIYRLRLKCVPAPAAATTGDTFTCLEFTVQFGAESEVAIPSLKGLSYTLDLSPDNALGDRPVLGVPHAPFERLTDANDRPIAPGNAYHVYNTFMDLHAFCNVFVTPMHAGNGIEDLTSIGQRIVHATAFSETPVNVGSNVAKGSSFKHGEVTLEFKGLGVVDGAACAILTVDSGQSSFAMTMVPAPNVEIKTVGSSHYKGDIYVDLAAKRVRKAEADEIIVCETTLATPPNKINTVGERNIRIRDVSREKD